MVRRKGVERWRTLLRRGGVYLAAIAAALAAVSIRAALIGVIGHNLPFFVLFLAITFVCLYFGRGPAAVAAITGYAADLAVGIPPPGPLFPYTVVSALIFITVIAAQIYFIGKLRLQRNALEAQHDLLHELIGRTPVAIAVLEGGEDARFTLANPAYHEAVHAQGDLLGRTLQEAFPDARWTPALSLLRESIRTRVPHELHEYKSVLPGQPDSWWNLQFLPLNDDMLLIIADDVTEHLVWRRTLQEAAEESERDLAEHRAVIASMADGLVVANASGELTTVNPAALRIHGFNEEHEMPATLDALERILELRDDGRVLPLAEWPISCALRGEAFSNRELRVRRKVGSRERIVSYSGTPIKGRGEQQRAVITLRDLTERRRIEAALQEADQRKDEFLGVLAHELRNPLAALSVGVSLLKRTKDEKRLAMVTEALEERTKQLARLIDDLLDVSRIARGKISLEQRAVDLRDVVELSLDTAGELIKQRQHEVEVELPPEPALVLGDPARLEQVVAHLLTNAAKYTEKHGRITVGVEAGRGRVVLRVGDSGIGVSPEERKRIFGLFSQGGRPAARPRAGGLGIGLTLVQRITELHGGSVDVISAGKGKGSEFVVTLPRMEEAQRAEQQASERAAAAEPGVRILLVEDDREAAVATAASLQGAGHRVEVAFDGQMALEIARRTRPEIVLLDISLPDIDGCEVGRRLRHELNLYESLIIAVTGRGEQRDRDASRRGGFDQHLLKPVRYETLAPLLADWQRRRRSLGGLSAHIT